MAGDSHSIWTGGFRISDTITSLYTKSKSRVP